MLEGAKIENRAIRWNRGRYHFDDTACVRELLWYCLGHILKMAQRAAIWWQFYLSSCSSTLYGRLISYHSRL